MLEHNLARAIAACASGARVTLTFTSGKSIALPIVPEPLSPAPPHPLEVVSQQLLERDAQTRETLTAVQLAVNGLSSEFAQGVKEIVGTLHLPVVPTKYDKDGRISEARRMEKPA